MRHRYHILALVGGLLAVAVVVGAVWATGGVYTQTRHGDPVDGVLRLGSEPRGDCAQCHDQHASRDGTPTGGPHPFMLFAANDNLLCATAGCHTGPGAIGIFQGPQAYDSSLHASAATMVAGSREVIGQDPPDVPGPRPPGDAGMCLNCHTPHGRDDGNGLIPSMLVYREETGCLGCHDGNPAAVDIDAEFAKPHRHPTGQFQKRHQAGESQPAAFETSSRHAECEDCHNPHDVRDDAHDPLAPTGSNRIQNVSRVAVVNGSAGTQPTYTFRPADDPSPVLEYELCFKCHSSWVQLPGGRPDLALLFNPNNPSYHPVEAVGQNTGIASFAFSSGWQPTDQMYCGDCHGGDTGVRGPHGSLNAGLLLKPYTASPVLRRMDPGELCFQCHRHDVYADRDTDNDIQGYSRWNKPEESHGHADHVDDEDVTCYSCHASHGSTSKPYLLVLGRNPGLVNWIDQGGGRRECFPTCHSPEEYDVNY